MRRAALASTLAGLLLGACGGDEPAPAAAPPTAGGETAPPTASTAPPPAVEDPNPWPGRTGLGTKAESPISACGPEDSYQFVAGEFRCPEGGNPLGGDPAAGARARVGNVGANSEGHIIDLYRVPCGGGEVDVFVDMYGCPEMQQRLQGLPGGP